MKFNFNTPYNLAKPTKLVKESFDFDSLEDDDLPAYAHAMDDKINDYLYTTEYIKELNKNATKDDVTYQLEDKVYDIKKITPSNYSQYQWGNDFHIKIQNNEIDIIISHIDHTITGYEECASAYCNTIQYFSHILIANSISIILANHIYRNPTPIFFSFKNINDMSYCFNICKGIGINKSLAPYQSNQKLPIEQYTGSACVIFGCASYEEYKLGIEMIKSATIFSTCNMVTIMPVMSNTNDNLCLCKSSVEYICKDILGSIKPENYFDHRHIKKYSMDYILKALLKMKRASITPGDMYKMAGTVSSKLLYAAWMVYNANTMVMPVTSNLEDYYNNKDFCKTFVKSLPINSLLIEKEVFSCLTDLFKNVKVSSLDFAAMYLYLIPILKQL